MTKCAVFISSSMERREIAYELSRQLERTAEVTFWSEGMFHLDKSIVESLTEVSDRSDFAIFVVASDDLNTARLSQSPRANLLFELGFFAGRLGLSRTFVVVDQSGKVALPTDLTGTMYIAMSMDDLPNLEVAIAPIASVIQKAMAHVGPRQRRVSEYYSCFISYSWKDKDFAARLHDDLKELDVRCWLDAKDIKAGDRWKEQIDKAIQAHDKVLLVLSEASVRSSWVRLEVRNALRLESVRRKTVLFPLRLDNAVLQLSGIQEFDDLREKYIADFSEWHDEARYRRSFSKLARDLAISASVESESPS